MLQPEAYLPHHPMCCGVEVGGDVHDGVLMCDKMSGPLNDGDDGAVLGR
jgi:hypothetical protein